MVRCRWKFEEDFRGAKHATGLDKGQVTTWASWHRWSTAALVAYAFLAVTAAPERDTDDDRPIGPSASFPSPATNSCACSGS
ncbi:hypothetical protein ACFV2D_37725 [Streptomyces capillispiralis]|uniref:hypothetical protein n=1 Tax=Streptomyces capillispiralis TaxID=68182 RepID=UPI0036AA30D5